jgi:hypothetical protein
MREKNRCVVANEGKQLKLLYFRGKASERQYVIAMTVQAYHNDSSAAEIGGGLACVVCECYWTCVQSLLENKAG